MFNEEEKKMSLREVVNAHAYPFLALISTLSLVITSSFLIEATKSVKEASKSLEPISEWAKIQNECVERTFRINGTDTRGIASKVWSCNGGGD